MSTEMSYKEKQEYVKGLDIGVNVFGMKSDELDAIIAENSTGTTSVSVAEKDSTLMAEVTSDEQIESAVNKPVNTPADDSKPAPATVDPAAVYAVLSKEIQDKFEALQKNQPQKKESTPEATIQQNHKSDRAVIASMKKVPITVPGGYVGAPNYVTACVNGYLKVIPAGAENVMVPLAVAEVLQRSRKLEQQNMEYSKKKEREAINAGL